MIGVSIAAANISTEQMVGMAGQAAGSVGLAVSAWQFVGSLGIVVIAMTLLARFLRAGIYTMPEFLEYRYNPAARAIMTVLTVVIYAVVMLPAVLYSDGVTLRALAGMDLTTAVWVIGLIGAVYSTIGGLKAIAWGDLVQGLALLAGGMLVFALGLHAIGGWETFARFNADKLHMILPASNKELPWTGIVSGMWIAALVLGPVVYVTFQFTAHSQAHPAGHELHFLMQVLLTFLSVSAVMLVMTWLRPLPEPRRLPERAGISLGTAPIVKMTGAAVILAVLFVFIVFR